MQKDPTKVRDEADQLQHLRDLIAGPTAKSLADLRQEVRSKSVNADEISDVLPAAIRKSFPIPRGHRREDRARA